MIQKEARKVFSPVGDAHNQASASIDVFYSILVFTELIFCVLISRARSSQGHSGRSNK